MASPLLNAERSLSPAEYKDFCTFFYQQTGISFGENKRYFVDKRLLERMEKIGVKSIWQYIAVLQRDADGELEALIGLLTIHETYFYREDHQFDCMVQSLLPELVAKRSKGHAIKIWSMPCATGEEPYSIAIHLLEHWSAVDDYDIEIIGSDIDSNVLRLAQNGVYSTRSLQRLPPHLISRYFEKMSDDRYRLISAIRQSVRFTQVNATDHQAMRNYAQIDIILCRNMLIYFDDKSRLLAAQLFYDCMAPGAFICLGHSESMSRISAMFMLRSFPQAIVYQKPRLLK